MINKDDILKKAINVDSKFTPSVYVLLDCDEIVYVGKSTNPYNRMGTHLSNKKFDKFTILHAEDFSVEDSVFDDLYSYFEELLIMKFKPKYNISIDCLIYASFDTINRETGMSKWEFKKLISKYKINHSVLNGLVYYKRKDIQDAIDAEAHNEAR